MSVTFRSRWAEPGGPETVPEPLDPRPRPSAWAWLRRSTATPVAAGAIVFLVVISAVILHTALLPHDPDIPHRPGETGSTEVTSNINALSSGETSGSAHAMGAEDTEEETIHVHVVGEVAQAGLYELASGSRVADALAAAGGATPSAVVEAVNLARRVSDGEQIIIPNPDNQAPVTASSVHAPGESGAGQLIHLNTAQASELENLPGIGPALAERIIDWRDSNGGFKSAEQLLEVSGIGEKSFARLSDLVTV